MESAQLRHTFGSKVRYFRKLRGWYLDDLAGRIGTTRASMSRIENGKQNMTIDQIEQIAAALEVPFGELWNDSSSLTCLQLPLLARRAAAQSLKKSAATIAQLQALISELEPFAAS